MGDVRWELAGQYTESCNCDYLCPCISSNAQAKPTHGECFAALLFQVDHGNYEAISLDGLNFGLALWTPTNMALGGKFALVIDESASAEQAKSLESIGSGDAGGPPAGTKHLAPNYLGSVRAPISFKADGASRTVSAGDFLRFHVVRLQPSSSARSSSSAESHPRALSAGRKPLGLAVGDSESTSGGGSSFGIVAQQPAWPRASSNEAARCKFMNCRARHPCVLAKQSVEPREQLIAPMAIERFSAA